MSTSRRPMSTDLAGAINKILQVKFPGAVIEGHQFLSEPERRNVILRLWVKNDGDDSTPTSMILKQSLPSSQLDIDAGEMARFARDWAGLEFVNQVAGEQHLVPYLYGADKDQRFMLLEDLGDKHISLIDSLLASDQAQAVAALQRFMQALAKLHALAYQQNSKFNDITASLIGPESQPDHEAEFKYFLTAIDPVMERLDLTIPIDQCEIKDVLSRVYDPNGPFSTLTHGDVAPDNMFDHHERGTLQLIDFESCKYRSALMDATHLSMSMPTAWCAKSIPREIVDQLETEYRETLSAHIPAAQDEGLYQRAYTDACAYHALHTMAIVGKCLDENPVWGSGPAPEGCTWHPEANLLRSRVLSRLSTFVVVAEKNNLYPSLRQAATDLLGKLKVKWPNDKPLDNYPAFRAAPEATHDASSALTK